MEFSGVDARVAFIENGKRTLYDLPAQRLQEAGIVTTNQPFQMDEVELKSDSGGVIFGYQFRPLAKESSAYSQMLSLNAERMRKRDLILKAFGQTKS